MQHCRARVWAKIWCPWLHVLSISRMCTPGAPRSDTSLKVKALVCILWWCQAVNSRSRKSHHAGTSADGLHHLLCCMLVQCMYCVTTMQSNMALLSPPWQHQFETQHVLLCLIAQDLKCTTGELMFGFVEENSNAAGTVGGRLINATRTAGQTIIIPQGRGC